MTELPDLYRYGFALVSIIVALIAAAFFQHWLLRLGVVVVGVAFAAWVAGFLPLSLPF